VALSAMHVIIVVLSESAGVFKVTLRALFWFMHGFPNFSIKTFQCVPTSIFNLKGENVTMLASPRHLKGKNSG
jgi:hypothetical protein